MVTFSMRLSNEDATMLKQILERRLELIQDMERLTGGLINEAAEREKEVILPAIMALEAALRELDRPRQRDKQLQ